MDIGKYKQAMSYLLNPKSTLKTFTINPNAKLADNDIQPVTEFASGGLAESFPELVKYLKSNEGSIINKSETARKFNVSEDTLNRKIKQYDLDIQSGGKGGSLLSQTTLPKEELDIFNKVYKTKPISQMASEITGLPYSNKITKAKNAQLYRHLLTQQKLGNVLKEDIQRGTRPKGTTPEDIKGFSGYTKAQQDLMNLNPKAYKDMTPSMLDNELKKLLQFNKVRGAFNIQPELAPSFEHIQGIVPGTITQDPEALKKVGITTKRYNFDLLGAKSKEGIYKGIKNNLRTAREALKLGDKEQAKVSLDLVNKAYDQVVEDYKTLNRDELPFYKVKGDDIKETNVKGIVKQRTLKKSLSEYIKNVSAVADPEEIKTLQPNLRKAVNLFKKGEDVAAEKLIQSRVPAVKEGALFMHVLPGQESVFDYVKSIGSDIKAGKVVSPLMKVLAPVGTALGTYDVYENLQEGKPLGQSALAFVGADPLAQLYREQSRLSPESKEVQKKIRTENLYEDGNYVPGLDVLPPPMEKATEEEKIKLKKEKEDILSELGKEEQLTAESRKKLFDYILNRINPLQEEEKLELKNGGRIGYADGSEDPNKLIPIDPLLQDQSPTNPGRRDVLKLGAVGAGLLGLGKLGLLKLGSAAKPSIITEAVKGTTAPSWMDSLVTKILSEGTEIKLPKESGIIKKEVQFKNPETGDVQKATLTINSKTDKISVEYTSPTNVADQSVLLELKREPKMVMRPDGKSFYYEPDRTKGYRFETTESGPRVVDWDGNIEFDAEDTYKKIIDLKSDISGLKSYATEGKGINKKIAQEKKAATADVENNPHEYVPDNYPDTKYYPND